MSECKTVEILNQMKQQISDLQCLGGGGTKAFSLNVEMNLRMTRIS
jgi:hypothetical protein